jgi:hypothetical protein
LESYLKNLDIWCWRYEPKQKNYPGLHFTARTEACETVLACLKRLRIAPPYEHRTIPLRTLRREDEAKVSGGRAFRSLRTLRIEHRAAVDELRQMHFSYEGERALWILTTEAIPRVEAGVTAVWNDTGDFCIGPHRDRKKGLFMGTLDNSSEVLWFWPCFGHISPR